MLCTEQHILDSGAFRSVSSSAEGVDVRDRLGEIWPTVWRAPTDNDGVAQGWMSAVSGVRPKWLNWGLRDAQPGENGYTHDVEETLLDGGGLERTDRLVIPDAWDDIARVGLRFEIDNVFGRLRWLGLGPHETYPDRRSSGILSVHESTVEEQYHSFVVPQEHGAHLETRWFEVRSDSGEGFRVEADMPFIFSVRGYRDDELANATTIAELVESQRSNTHEVHIDMAMREENDRGRCALLQQLPELTYESRCKRFHYVPRELRMGGCYLFVSN